MRPRRQKYEQNTLAMEHEEAKANIKKFTGKLDATAGVIKEELAKLPVITAENETLKEVIEELEVHGPKAYKQQWRKM